jgi:hypothetical protein
MTRGKHDTTTIPGIRLTYGTPVRIGLNLVLPKGASGAYEFDLVRLEGEQIVGGVTYSIRVGNETRSRSR